jgi:hypothetical protein
MGGGDLQNLSAANDFRPPSPHPSASTYKRMLTKHQQPNTTSCRHKNSGDPKGMATKRFIKSN